MKKFDVLGIGQSCIDILGFIPFFPSIEQRVELQGPTIQRGGPTANALNVLTRFGCKVALMSVIGDDSYGDLLLEELQTEGIDTSLVVRKQGQNTQISLIPVEKNTGKRTVFWSRGPVGSLSDLQIDPEIAQNSRLIHTDDIYVAPAIEIIKAAKKSGVLVSVDLGSLQPGVEKLKGNVDLLITSLEFMKDYTGEEDPRVGIRKLLDFGAEVTTVTLEEMGSITVYDDETIEIPAYSIDAVDTTGCGDVFHGSFIYAWLQGWDIMRTLHFATAAAAISTRSLGASTGLPESAGEVLKFMNENGS